MKNTDIAVDFNIPAKTGLEMEYIQQAFDQGHISGDGSFTKRCSKLMEELLGVQKVLLTTSCTHALEMSALLLSIKPGDEVILPSFTFVSTVNAFVLRGAKPVFIDIRPDTLNMDEKLLPQMITEHTRAIIPVHYAGIGCEMDEICTQANKYGLIVIEDNAHGLFGKYKRKPLGTLGALSTLSFHETKNLSCGEGGALVINDPALITRAEYIREKGTNRSRFYRGMIDKYTWVDIGSSYLPSDILAAILLAQLEHKEKIQAKRQMIWENYHQNLQSWARTNSVQLPSVPEECTPAYHIYYMLLPTLQHRQAMIEHLRSQGILSVFHYLPLHLSDMGRQFGGKEGDCPVTENVSDRLLRLPLHYHMTPEQQSYVIEKITSVKI